jgi:hypothetical protein
MTSDKLPQVFRESFLLLFEEQEPQVALRALDRTINSVVWEGKDALETGRAEPLLRRETSGAIGDLQQAIESIANLGSWIEAAELKREEARLSILAGDVAAELEPLAERLEAGLAAYLASPPAE